MTGRKGKPVVKIREITEQDYFREIKEDGSVVFCKGDPFKTVTSYDVNGNPFEINVYYSDGLFSYYWGKENFDWYYGDCHLAESQFDDDGLTVYKRYEPKPDMKERHWFLSQELFYEYRNGLLFRKEIITRLPASATDQNGALLIDSGYTEPLIRKEEAFCDEKGDVIRWLRYDINSSEITSETTYRYEYDRHGNLIYSEDRDSSGAVRGKTYRTIKYWEDEG